MKNKTTKRTTKGGKRHVFTTIEELRKAVDLCFRQSLYSKQAKALKIYGPINTWDVSQITNMSYLFKGIKWFNGNINDWDVSNVTDMSYMFSGCIDFNRPLDKWDVSKVTNMGYMFYGCNSLFGYNFFMKRGDISGWNVSNVTNMEGMFANCVDLKFSLNSWDVSNVTNMSYMFYNCTLFNKPLNNWNVSSVTNMSCMFYKCRDFNQPLNDWNVSNVTNMSYMFYGCKDFKQPLDNWDASKVTDYEISDLYEIPPIIRHLRKSVISNVIIIPRDKIQSFDETFLRLLLKATFPNGIAGTNNLRRSGFYISYGRSPKRNVFLKHQDNNMVNVFELKPESVTHYEQLYQINKFIKRIELPNDTSDETLNEIFRRTSFSAGWTDSQRKDHILILKHIINDTIDTADERIKHFLKKTFPNGITYIHNLDESGFYIKQPDIPYPGFKSFFMYKNYNTPIIEFHDTSESGKIRAINELIKKTKLPGTTDSTDTTSPTDTTSHMATYWKWKAAAAAADTAADAAADADTDAAAPPPAPAPPAPPAPAPPAPAPLKKKSWFSWGTRKVAPDDGFHKIGGHKYTKKAKKHTRCYRKN